jgi:iron complex outermembrane recepter protein
MTRFRVPARAVRSDSLCNPCRAFAKRRHRRQLVLTIATLLLICARTNAQEEVLSPADGTRLSLEQLMEARIYSVSKKPQKLATAASAISVITEEDVQRSGANNIPDALRLAPGVQVGRVDSQTWAISARGFNDVFANKLLVLQDGRSIYTPLFSGVFWDEKDVLLEDLDRIEVIRGPGATLWGANAVNGVINIITKPARDTQGWLVSAGGGTEDRTTAGVRYGGKIGENAFYRLYGKYLNHDDSVTPSGDRAGDSWQMGRGGFRADWNVSDQNLFIFEGEGYGGREHETYIVPTPPLGTGNLPDRKTVTGGSLLGRWTHTFSDESDVRLQSYWDRTVRDTEIFRETRDTYDIDFQHRFPIGDWNDLIWGAEYRASSDDIGNTPVVALEPPERTKHLASAFVQDQIALVKDRLELTLGSKFEYNSYTHFEVQPGGRLAWTPNEKQTVWGSISRAVRTPSRAEHDVILHQAASAGTPFTLEFRGNPEFESEKLVAYEIGYRHQFHPRASVDLALFYNDYDELRSIEPLPALGPTVFTLGNKLTAEAYGIEIAPAWQVTDWWRLQAAYSYLEIQLHHNTVLDPDDEGRSPRHQFTLRSLLDLPANVQFDAAVRYIDSLPALNIPNYLVMDLRLAWRPLKNLELAIIGRDLLDSHHPEFAPSNVAVVRTEVEQSVFGKITWRF